jgi:hypothetical protein
MNLWQKISNLGITENDAKGDVRRIHLINRSCALAVVTTFFFAGYMLVIGVHFYFPVQILVGLFNVFSLFLSFKRLFSLSCSLLLLSLFFNVSYASLELKGSGVEYFSVTLAMLPFLMYKNKNICLLLSGLSGLAFLILYSVRKTYIPHDVIAPQLMELTYYMVMAGVFFTCGMLIFQFRMVNDKYEGIIESQFQEVEQKNKEITDSIRYAKRIQQSIMPTSRFISRSLKRLKKEE